MLIEFSFDPKLLFLLVFPIFKQLAKFVREKYIKKDRILFRTYRIFLSFELSIIFLLIFKCKNKSSKKEIISDENEKNYEYKNSENKLVDIELKRVAKKNKIKSFLFLLLLSAIYISSYLFNYLVGNDHIKFSRNSIGIIYEIIQFYILSKLILKEKYYRHHHVSTLIICVSLLVLFINYSVQIEIKDDYYNLFWYFFIYVLLYDLFNVLLKLYLNTYFHSIYFIILSIGTIICIPFLIYDIIAFYVNKDASGVIIGFIDNIKDVKDFFLFLCELIFQLISCLGIIWTIYYFTPFHFIVSEFLSELISYYIKMAKKNPSKNNDNDFIFKTHNIIIFTIIFFINFICSLIFNEIIILKFCKLEYYTKTYIKDRATIDTSSLFLQNENILPENEPIIDNEEENVTN